MLRREGYVADCVASAEAADAELRAARPDLVILDVGVPGTDGFAWLKRLRSDGGEEAGEDEACCAAVCAALGVELEIRRPSRPEGNLQAWARDVRYAEAATLARGALVAAGHTATDQAETILYRLAASPGRRALLGMPVRSGHLVRPLLAGLSTGSDDSRLDQRVVALVFVGLLTSALVTEFIGIHAIFGAFLFGAVIPHDSAVARVLSRKLEDVVTVLLMPAFFSLFPRIHDSRSVTTWLRLRTLTATASGTGAAPGGYR